MFKCYMLLEDLGTTNVLHSTNICGVNYTLLSAEHYPGCSVLAHLSNTKEITHWYRSGCFTIHSIQGLSPELGL